MIASFVTLEEYNAIDGSISDMTDKLLLEASLKIDKLTFGRARNESLCERQLDLIKLATCKQANHIHSNQDADGFNNVSNYSVLGMSVSFESKDFYNKENIQKSTFDLLVQSGLAWRGL